LGDAYVVRIDLLGHARSAKPDSGYSMAEQARRVGAVLDQLGVRHAIVVGHSTGGYVTTSLAEQRRDLVSAIALISAGPRLDAFTDNGPVIEEPDSTGALIRDFAEQH
jgi:pimeloyl-ACP methyl ester carboxylesterase